MTTFEGGISYDINTSTFEFDFQTSKGENLIIGFDELPLEKILLESFDSSNIYYFGYEFTKDTSSQVRTKFFHELRFNDNFTSKENKENFVKLALTKLKHQTGSVYDFDILVIPKSRSSLNAYMVNIFSRMTNINFELIELVKDFPQNIKFDWAKFELEELNSIINGVPRYTGKQKQEQIYFVENMLNNIHQSDYFSIAESTRRNKYKKYFSGYLKLESNHQRDDYQLIRNTKKPILVIDDVTTTGTTLLECLKNLRDINDTVDIILFTLIGKKIF
jgi:hypothetical protein